MKHTLARGVAITLGLTAPVLAFAQDFYNDYGYNDYDYNYDYNYDSSGVTAGAAALGIGMMIFIGIMALIGLALLIFTIWMIIDAAKRDFDQKAMWIILMVFFGWIAALIYFFMVKRKNVTRAHPKGASTVTPPVAK